MENINKSFVGRFYYNFTPVMLNEKSAFIEKFPKKKKTSNEREYKYLPTEQWSIIALCDLNRVRMKKLKH